MAVPHWSRMAAVVAATGLTERDDALFVMDLLRPGEIFVDVGSNIGFYTVLAPRRGALVHAFDPTPEACDVCEQNARLNRIDASTRVHRAACSDSTGLARFTSGLDIKNHIAGPNETGLEVAMVTIDDLIAAGGPDVAMIKIDAEGHDLEVLKGAMRTIDDYRPAVLIEIWSDGADVADLLADLGYRSYSYKPRERRLSLLPPDRRRPGNLLMLPQGRVDAIQQRLADAVRPRAQVSLDQMASAD